MRLLILLGGLLLLAVVTIVIQIRRAVAVQLESTEMNRSLPSRIAATLIKIVETSQKQTNPEARIPPGWPSRVEYADVNDDTIKELLVQYPTGAHGSAIKIFEWRESEFKEVADLRVGTPVGFEIGDFDGDGKIELRTEETDWSAGLSYDRAPRLVLLFRWDGSSFRRT